MTHPSASRIYGTCVRGWCRGALAGFSLAAGLGIASSQVIAGCLPPPSGLVGWWPGDTDAEDVGSTNHGSLAGGAVAGGPGFVGGGFSFDGTNGYVQIADFPLLHLTNLTLEAWVRFDSLDTPGNALVGQQYIVFKQNTRVSAFEGFFLGKLRTQGGDRFEFVVTGASGQTGDIQSSTLISAGEWYHVAGVRGPNSVQLYVDGALESQASVSFPQDYGSQPLFFGTSGQSYWDRKFSGSLDEVSLYDRALSAEEIQTIYTAGTSGKCKPHLAPKVDAQPLDQSVVAGQNVRFSVAVSGTEPLAYAWQRNGVGLTNGGSVGGADTPVLRLAAVQTNDSAQYQVRVTNDFGAVTSTVATLTVLPGGACYDAPAGLIGWWPGDGDGSDIANTNSGTLLGGATCVPAVVGQGFVFDGTNGYVQVPDSPQFHLPVLTVECWARFSELESSGNSPLLRQQYIVFKKNSRVGNFEGFNLSKDAGPSPDADVILWEATSAAGQLTVVGSQTPITTNVWYHLAATRGPDFIQLYVNGQLEAQTTIAFPQDYGDRPLFFGSSGESYYDHKMAGMLDEVAIYNRVLSGSEIEADFAGGAGGKCKAPRIKIPPQSQTAMAGTNVVFTVVSSSVMPVGYQWLFGGVSVPSATNASLTVSNVQFSSAGSYSVRVTNTLGEATGAAATLIVLPLDSDGDGMPDDWEIAHGLNPNDPADASADPDGDGQPNLTEYALGTDPHNPADGSSGLRTALTSEGGTNFLTAVFKRRKTPEWITYRPEVSGDRTNWFGDGAHAQETSVVPVDAEFDLVTVRDLTPTTESAPRFVRVRLVKP